MACGVTVHLIRHEQTGANKARKYIGWTDEPIFEPVQAELLLQPWQVFGSDLQRCMQTAACYFPGTPYIAVQGLRELHFGDFEMCTYEQLQHNEQYRAWIDHPLLAAIPNGESFSGFQRRVLDAFHQIVAQEGDYTFVVHGGVIRLLLANYGTSGQPFQQTTADHRTVYTLHWNSLAQLKGGWRCTSYSEAPITVKGPM